MRDYLRMIAASDPAALLVTAYVAAPSREERTFANFAVFGTVDSPRLQDGGVDFGELERVAKLGQKGESDGEVERRDLPWGPALRSTWTKVDPERPDLQNRRVCYSAVSDELGAAFVLAGRLSAPESRDISPLLSDIETMASTLSVALESDG